MRPQSWAWIVLFGVGIGPWGLEAARGEVGAEIAAGNPLEQEGQLVGPVVGSEPFVTDRVLVRFKPGLNRASKDRTILEAKGLVTRRVYRAVSDLELVVVPNGRVKEVIAGLQADPRVLYAEPDYLLQLMQTPDDALYTLLWGMHNTGQVGTGSFCYAASQPGADINAERAWDFWQGDPEFKIAVIDTGINYLHPDLAANTWTNPLEVIGDRNGDGCPGVCGVDDDGDGLIDEDSKGRQPNEPGYTPDLTADDDENGWNDDIHGYDAFNNDSDPMDDHSHGSHVSGTIGGIGNNGIGVAGVNWRCKIVALKIFGRTGAGGAISDAVESMDYIIANRIRVSNNSWGFSGFFSQALYDAIEASQEVGHLFVAAAGNDFARDLDLNGTYPSGYNLPNIISVAAADNRFTRAPFSNQGKRSVDLAAPGSCIMSTVLGTDYGYKDGTSMATPHVAGVVGLVTSRYPGDDWRKIRERVLYTVRPASAFAGITVFGGTVDAQRAIGDCNQNGVLDAVDITSGVSSDCSGNGVPDECEPDCNGNARADSCDLFDRTSIDCDDNGRPDECEPDCDGNGAADPCDVATGLRPNCNRNSLPDDCEIAADGPSPGGPYYCESRCESDCNLNGIPDICDLQSGLSRDCSFNRIPDECEPDCNINKVADSCDLADGTSNDCGYNGIPDECEPDCNDNGRADSCDIYSSVSTDCDRNRIPDECEPDLHTDCNQNNRFDLCDSTFGQSHDCNSNSVLDECDIRDGTSTDLDLSEYPDECDGRGFSLVPVSASGEYEIVDSEIRMLGGGQTVTLELRLFNWDLDLDGEPKLRAYEIRVESDGFRSGTYGELSPAKIPCKDSEQCFGRSLCLATGYCDIYGSAFIDPYRPEFIFHEQLSVQFTNPIQFAPDITFLAALWSQTDIIPDDGEEHYVGTLMLDVSPVAAGTFTVGFTPRSAQLRKGSADPITVPTVSSARIYIEADCNLNKRPDDQDIAGGLSPDCNGNGIPDECIELEEDCNRNGSPDDCDIAGGLSSDCNGNSIPDDCIRSESDCNLNGLPDECDIGIGISLDCNGNGIPDDCADEERDCNGNHIPDTCDILFGSSADCNQNGVPDECLLFELDCNANQIPDFCDMVTGVSTDCNQNRVPDSCDLSDGTSADCNDNDIPDECPGIEVDCNRNENPDSCDINEGISGDCNANQIPDECDIRYGGSLDADGDGVPDECNRIHRVPSQYPTIQSAINSANSGDLILVADGVYFGPGNRSISFLGKLITVRSENGPKRCIVDGRKAGRGFQFTGRETLDARLEGFTITGGYADNGGGILCRRSSPTIVDCIIAGNTAGTFGGGIYCDNSSHPLIRRCTLAVNTAGHDGGAVYCENMSSPTIENSIITQNIAVGGGGALLCDNLSVPLIRYCTLTANRAGYGGAIYAARRTIQAPGFVAPIIRNSILWANVASFEGSEIYLANGAQLAVEGSAVLGAMGTVVVRSTAELRWDESNITENPVLRNPAGPDNDFFAWEDNDFRLHRLSPCINGGVVELAVDPEEVDLEGHARILCVDGDMGAFEFGIGDFDCDGQVDVADLLGWDECATGPDAPEDRQIPKGGDCITFDFNHDGDVDLEDLARLQRMMQR